MTPEAALSTIPVRQILAVLAEEAGMHPAEMRTMSVEAFMRAVGAARMEASERETMRPMPAAEVSGVTRTAKAA